MLSGDNNDNDDNDMLPQSVSAKVRQYIITLHTYCLLISLADISMDPEQVDNVLLWWHERKSMYPHLSRMALNYLTIPGE